MPCSLQFCLVTTPLLHWVRKLSVSSCRTLPTQASSDVASAVARWAIMDNSTRTARCSRDPSAKRREVVDVPAVTHATHDMHLLTSIIINLPSPFTNWTCRCLTPIPPAAGPLVTTSPANPPRTITRCCTCTIPHGVWWLFPPFCSPPERTGICQPQPALPAPSPSPLSPRSLQSRCRSS